MMIRNIKIFIKFDDDKEEGRYPPSLSGCLVEEGECRVEVNISSQSQSEWSALIGRALSRLCSDWLIS